MINAQDIKNGTCIRMDGKLYFCIEFLHVKPGKGAAFVRVKMKNIIDGAIVGSHFIRLMEENDYDLQAIGTYCGTFKKELNQ